MIQVEDIAKAYAGQRLFRELSWRIPDGARIGLVGPNGVGKTTLCRLLAGLEEPDAGRISRPRETTVGYLSQEVAGGVGGSVLAAALSGFDEVWRIEYQMEEVAAALSGAPNGAQSDALTARYGDLQHRFEALGGYRLETAAKAILGGLGFRDADFGRPLAEFSGGWRMRAALARLLLLRPALLLLDEPTNHLDIESIVWLERFLRNSPATILMTSHDRDFMNRVVTKIVEIDDGDIVTYSGDYDFYVRERELRETNQEAAYARQQAKLAKEQRFIDRFTAHAAKAAQVQSRIKMLDKQERIEPPKKRRAMKFDFRRPPRSGDEVATLAGVKKAFGAKRVYDDFDFQVRRGERWCVMGKNGAGKTTLLKMVAGTLPPDSGTVKLGASLTLGYFAQQSLDLLDPDLTVWEQIQKDFPLEGQGVLRNLLGAFQFSGDDVEKRIRSLSGGEKSRLVMARMLLDPPNFLVLDEPTNHLDVATKEMLIEALKDFEGTMLFVSHDRTFLRGLANRVLELDARPTTYGGTYSEYVEQSGHEAPGVHA